MRDDGRDVGGIDDGGEECDGEVGGEEVGFVEAVEEDDEAHGADGASLGPVDVFVDVGGSEVVEVRIVDPAGDAVCRAAKRVSSAQKKQITLALRTRMLEITSSIASRRSSSR